MLADTLSRASLSPAKGRAADDIVTAHGLRWVYPSLHPIDTVQHLLYSRPGTDDPGRGRTAQTGDGESAEDDCKQKRGSKGLSGVLPQVSLAPAQTSAVPGLHVYQGAECLGFSA